MNREHELLQTSLDVESGVGVLTLRNVGRRNAWNGRMAAEYRMLLHECDSRDDVRAVVVTGEGDDFCVGADFRELSESGAAGGYSRQKEIPPAPFPTGADESLKKNHMYPLTVGLPVVSAIQGGCAGAGFVVSTYADLRVIDPAARVSSSYAGLGLPAEYGIGWMLPRIMGTAQAAAILLDSGSHSGSDAYRMGWAQYLSPPGEVLVTAKAIAERIATSSAPSSVAMVKRQLYVDAWLEAPEAYNRSVNDMNAAVRTDEFRRSVRARQSGKRVDFRTMEARPSSAPISGEKDRP